ncbi:MAG: hypothetical protein A3G81_05655 [Betaproteobacteria bacterium RIFCSPLOWO2_12_FULL_65_14]|nr:MAG: hypothetical protein A3G81_05655 [Betaproteobacteria bacterium RIFCSPLOWO2_12_FULL_65_14]
MKLAITLGKVRLEADLLQSETAKALVAALPFESRAQTWGEEVYFTTPVSAKLEAGARQVVEPGSVCFWCEGNAIALPYGRTPISTDARPKLASRCNILGHLDDFRGLASVKAGDKVRVEAA